jgi:hypothetical protein
VDDQVGGGDVPGETEMLLMPDQVFIEKGVGRDAVESGALRVDDHLAKLRGIGHAVHGLGQNLTVGSRSRDIANVVRKEVPREKAALRERL